ncbi:hypothetical protein BDQ17DRAFT_1372407 [Cyathus striatus]|nr:hypothetical protein BDQ17DRAFT_1372407 [Cyathus striatus]
MATGFYSEPDNGDVFEASTTASKPDTTTSHNDPPPPSTNETSSGQVSPEKPLDNDSGKN